MENDSLKIVFVGDSLIEYFDWQDRFPGHQVLNLGLSGETVGGLAARIRRIIGSATVPDVIFIMSGINNIASEDFGIIDEYRQILKRLKIAYPSATIAVQSILPVNLSWVDNTAIEEINRSLRGMSSELKVEYLDIYSSFIDSDGYPEIDFLLDDGVHLSEKGYEVWSGKVAEFLDYLPKKSSSSRSSSSRE